MLFAIVGPVFGFILGGQFLNMYVDFDKVDTERQVFRILNIIYSQPGIFNYIVY